MSGTSLTAPRWRLRRARLTSRPGEAAALDTAALDIAVADEAEAPALARVLDREFAADPAFRAEIKALLRGAGARTRAAS
jgi:hypothetical protein